MQKLPPDRSFAKPFREWHPIHRIHLNIVAGYADGVTAVKETCRVALDPLTAVQHINGNHMAHIDGDTAAASCYFHVHQVRAGTPGGDHFEMGGRYEDELERHPDGWRIRRRRLTIIWSNGNPAVRWDR